MPSYYNKITKKSGKDMLKTIGKSGQISLGKEYAGRHALVEEIEPGVWVIKLGTFVPDDERWLWEPATQQRVDQALDWAAEHPPEATDLADLAEQASHTHKPKSNRV